MTAGEGTRSERPPPETPGEKTVERKRTGQVKAQTGAGKSLRHAIQPTRPPRPAVPRRYGPPRQEAHHPRDSVITLTGVSKTYRGVLGLNGVTLSFRRGITGILGENGSGKSTMLKLITGLLVPSSGEVTIRGENPRNNPRIFKGVGYCPEYDAFYDGMSGLAYVAYFLRLNGLEKGAAERRASMILEKLDLGDAAARPVDGYSKGMKQRVKLARAISTDPDILILDEPLQGTDPEARHLIIENLKEWEKRGKTILISSHILHEVELLTDSIVLMSRGRVIARGNVYALRNMIDSRPHSVLIVPREPAEARRLASILVGQDYVTSAGVEESADPADPRRVERRVRVHTRTPSLFYRRIAGILHENDIPVKYISSQDDNLEALYHYLMQWQSREFNQMQWQSGSMM